MDLFTIDITLPRRTFDLRAELTLGQQTLALVGPSGSGKTSLLRTIAGLEHSARGRIALGSQVWLDSRAGVRVTPERRRVGYLPQDYGLFPHMTVAANVRFAARRDRDDLLERLKIEHLARVRPGELSGGERQRVALARALAREPQVLLLDEPFGALDTITRRHVRDELADILADLSLPTVLVTHDFEDATLLAGRVGVIDHGRLVQLDDPAELHERPANALVAALTGANVLHGHATPTASGARVQLDGGGTLDTDTPADGVVALAVQPSAFTLTSPGDASLTDRVVALRQDGGTVIARLTRLTVHLPLAGDGHAPVAENAVVGLRAAPGAVRVLPAVAEETSREGARARS